MAASKKQKVPAPVTPASREPVEKDTGYDASHGYGPGHGGPSGPGDAPAPEDASQEHVPGPDSDELDSEG